MRPKIRFTLIVTRQILGVIEEFAFPREPRPGSHRPSPRVAMLLRVLRIVSSSLVISRAWRDLNSAHAQPRRKGPSKNPPPPERRRDRSRRPRTSGDS